MGNPYVIIRYKIMLFMPIPKLIHYVFNDNYSTQKLVKGYLFLIVYIIIFYNCSI